MKAKYKMRLQKTETFMAAYFFAAKAYQFSECNEYMQNLRMMHPTTTEYLENDVGLHRWTRAYFPSRRYNLLTTNIVESMNSLLRHIHSLLLYHWLITSNLISKDGIINVERRLLPKIHS